MTNSISKSIISVLTLGLLASSSVAHATSPETEVPFVVNVGVAAHPFVRNHGQASPEIQYTAHSYGGDLLVGSGGIAVELTGDEAGRGGRVEANFVGVEGLEFIDIEPASTQVNIYRGADEHDWLEGLEGYATIAAGLDESVALELAATGRDLQWRFDGQSAAAFEGLAWTFADAQMVEVDDRGRLVVTVAARAANGKPLLPWTREVYFAPPLAWDVEGGNLSPRAAAFVVEDGRVSIALGKGSGGPVHVEATLRYSPRQGSADVAQRDGALWATGTGRDQLLAMRLDAEGQTIEALSVMAGSTASEAGGLSVTEDGRVWLAGTSWAADFPTFAAIQPERSGASDAVLVELDPEGTLLSSTYFGGLGLDAGADVELDHEGRLWLATRGEEPVELPPLDLPFSTRVREGQANESWTLAVIDDESIDVIGGTCVGGTGGGGVVIDVDDDGVVSIGVPLAQLSVSAPFFHFSHSAPHTGCSSPNDAWGQEALCWKARAENVPYNPQNVHGLLTTPYLFWGSYLDLDDDERNTNVFPNGDPRGTWQGAYATAATFPQNVASSAEELALAAALYMFRWDSPVYVNHNGAYQGAVGLHEVVFDVADPTQFCSSFGFLAPGTPGFNAQPIYQVAASCSANAAFAIHGMDLSWWDNSNQTPVYHPSVWHPGVGGFVVNPNYDNHYVGDPPAAEAHMAEHFSEIAAQLADKSTQVEPIVEVHYEGGDPVGQYGIDAAVHNHLAQRRANRRAAGTDSLGRL